MDDAAKVMLIDDGELDPLPPILDAMGIAFTRVRGGGESLAPPQELLIASPRRARRIRRGQPEGARSGRPLRIIAVEEDSPAMRRLLQRLGFHLLVRQPAPPSVWCLLIERALYDGEERRVDDRVPVGSEVSLRATEAGGEAFLVDISNRGCRLLCEGRVAVEEPIELAIDLANLGAETLSLRGTVVRAEPATASDGRAITTVGVLFARDLSERDRRGLATLLNRFTAGPGSLLSLDPEAALPPAPSAEFPELTLDHETDPAVAANLAVRLQSDAERRSAPRAHFGAPLVVREGSRQRVLLGRDLSSGGMRVEPTPQLSTGQRFRLAIHGPGDDEPTRVDARVARDDGEQGWLLEFEGVDAPLRRRLEKIVACLPAIAAFDDAPETGSLLSEILEDELD